MTALTINGSAHAASTLAAAGQLYSATGGTSGNTSTKVGTSTQFKQIFALGTSTNQTGVSSIPAPTDANWHGWMWDATTLEGQEIAAGTWTPTIHLLASTGTTVTPTVQWYKRSSAGGYTSIGSVAGSSIALTTSAQLLVFTAPSLSLMDFATGDKLMMWLWVNQTAGGATNSTISVVEATSASTSGVAAGEAKTVTPGYAPIPVALSTTIAGVGTEKATLYANGAAQLTVYPVHIAASGLTTANRLVDSGSGTTGTGVDTALGLATGWGEVVALGTVQTWGTGITALTDPPTGKGMLYDLTTLEGMTLITGNYTPTRRVRINGGNGNLTVDMYIRFYKYNPTGPTYTLIGTTSLLAQTFTSTSATLTFSPISLSYMDFAPSEKLYIDEPMNVTANANTLTAGTIRSDVATSTTIGELNSLFVTSGYILTPPRVALSAECDGVGALSGYILPGTLTLYGSSTADSTITTACDMATNAGIGGIETSATTLDNNNGQRWLEFTSQGLTVNNFAAMQLPTGNGWVYQPGAGTFAAGNWSAVVNLATAGGTVNSSGLQINFYQYSGGVYTSIGGILLAFPVFTPTKAQYTLAATSMPTATFAATDLLYIDLWLHDGASANNDHPVVYQSTSVSAGVASDMAITTAVFTPSSGVALTAECDGIGTLTETLSLATALTVECDGVGTLAGTAQLSTALTVECDGIGTLTGTLSTSGGVSLSVTMAGVGTLTETLSLATALTSTIAGVGTLTPTLSANLTLPSVTISGVGTLTATMSETTALSATISGVGLLSETLSLATALSTTMTGVGTLTATLSTTGGVSLAVTMTGVGTFTPAPFTEKTALAVTVPGVGTLAPTLSANMTLAGATMPGVGVLTATLSARTALSVSCSGTGTLSGVFTIRIALFVTCAATSTLSGVITIPILTHITLVWMTRDLKATWTARDMKATWMTRDEKAAWNTRDEKAAWTARDMQDTWETRG